MRAVNVAAHHAIQFLGLFVASQVEIKPIQRNVQGTYANVVRDSNMRRTRHMSGTASYNRQVQFLVGVKVREISIEDWMKANETFKPGWFG